MECDFPPLCVNLQMWTWRGVCRPPSKNSHRFRRNLRNSAAKAIYLSTSVGGGRAWCRPPGLLEHLRNARVFSSSLAGSHAAIGGDGEVASREGCAAHSIKFISKLRFRLQWAGVACVTRKMHSSWAAKWFQTMGRSSWILHRTRHSGYTNRTRETVVSHCF